LRALTFLGDVLTGGPSTVVREIAEFRIADPGQNKRDVKLAITRSTDNRFKRG
jgi:hypothetical protein